MLHCLCDELSMETDRSENENLLSAYLPHFDLQRKIISKGHTSFSIQFLETASKAGKRNAEFETA